MSGCKCLEHGLASFCEIPKRSNFSLILGTLMDTFFANIKSATFKARLSFRRSQACLLTNAGIFTLGIFGGPAQHAFAAQPAIVTQSASVAPLWLQVEARVGDISRSDEWVISSPRMRSTFGQVARFSQEGLQVELTPRETTLPDGTQGILFRYKILKQDSGRWTPLSQGSFRANANITTRLLVSDLRAGHLIDLSVTPSKELSMSPEPRGGGREPRSVVPQGPQGRNAVPAKGKRGPI